MTDQFLKYSKYPHLLRLEALEKIENQGIQRIFIDEIQRVPELLNEVHFLIEKTGCRFLMTGSSARKLRKGGTNLLAGRAVQRHLFPFVYEEIAEAFSLDEVLRFGTLPAVYGRSTEEKIDILNSYTETYLREEIYAEGLVRNLGGFSRLLDLAASQCGELISFTSIGRDCHVATRTVQAYYEILLHYCQSEAGIYFWRTNHGAEVDLVIEKYGKIVGAFEIKSQSRIAGAHLSGLRSFRSEYPDVPLYVIAMVENA